MELFNLDEAVEAVRSGELVSLYIQRTKAEVEQRFQEEGLGVSVKKTLRLQGRINENAFFIEPEESRNRE